MFNHPRRSSNGSSIPTWLSTPGPVLLRRHCRTNKYEPLVDEVQLIEANPEYAYVRLPNGNETTVSLRHLAPKEDVNRGNDNVNIYNTIDYQEGITENDSISVTDEISNSQDTSGSSFPQKELVTEPVHSETPREEQTSELSKYRPQCSRQLPNERPKEEETSEEHKSRPQRNRRPPKHWDDFIRK